jgi:hypothetical protein
VMHEQADKWTARQTFRVASSREHFAPDELVAIQDRLALELDARAGSSVEAEPICGKS